MRATQMDDDLDTPIQQLIKVVSTHEEIISKLESASDKLLRYHRHEKITLRSYYSKFKDCLMDMRDMMDLMITLMKQTTQKIRMLETSNRRMAKCTLQRLLKSTSSFLDVSDDIFKSLLKSKQVLLKLVRRLSIATKDKSIDCSLGTEVATRSCSTCIRCISFGESTETE